MPKQTSGGNGSKTALPWLGRYVSARKIEALRRLELISAGLVARDEGQAPDEVGPPIAPLHS